MFSLTTLILVFVVAVAAGYVLRHYVEKTWPNEARMVDGVATKYGEAAAAEVRRTLVKAKAYAASLDD